MFEAIIALLLHLCLFALVVFIVLYVLQAVGITIPPRVLQILWVMALLVVILFMFRLLAPSLGSLHFPSARGITVCEGYSNCG